MNEEHREANTVCFPEMRKGEVAICLATVLARSSGLKEPLLDYPNQQIASAMARGQLAYYRIMEEMGQLRMLRNWQDVEAHLGEWRAGSRDSAPLGYILSMEGADPYSPRGTCSAGGRTACASSTWRTTALALTPTVPGQPAD